MIKANEGIVVIKELETPENNVQTESGIVVTKKISAGPKTGRVIDIGYINDGSGKSVPFSMGEKILFKEGTGWEYNDGTEKYRFLRFDDILGVLKGDEMTM
jgi:co-chaperonin GroES (HSP10)